MFTKIFSFFLVVYLWVGAGMSYAQPIVNSISGTLSHKGTVVISGAGFGTKSPAAPLWWDDGEGATVNNSSVMMSGEMTWVTSTLTGSNKHYAAVSPRYAVGDAIALENRMTYHSGTLDGVSAPHSRSTKYLSGEHDDNFSCVAYGTTAQNVSLTMTDGVPSPTWFIHYYLRLSPNWPIDTTKENNYKFFVWERTAPYGSEYHGSNWDYDNWTTCGATWGSPGCGLGLDSGRVYTTLNTRTCANGSPTWGYPYISYAATGSARTAWQAWEHQYHNGGSHATDVFRLFINNSYVVDISLDDDCSLDDNAHAVEVGGVTIGGFWRQALCGGADDFGPGARRFFDDVYIDKTFSRTMLCNNAAYASATICEPQIPSAWNATTITAVVNLGGLPSSGTAYLFVFDSQNNHNATGFPVVIGAGGGTNGPPFPPFLNP